MGAVTNTPEDIVYIIDESNFILFGAREIRCHCFINTVYCKLPPSCSEWVTKKEIEREKRVITQGILAWRCTATCQVQLTPSSCLEILVVFNILWDRLLQRIRTSKNCIHLNSNILRPVDCTPYRSRQTLPKLVAVQAKTLLTEIFNYRLTTEWIATITFASKHRSFGFCENYGKLFYRHDPWFVTPSSVRWMHRQLFRGGGVFSNKLRLLSLENRNWYTRWWQNSTHLISWSVVYSPPFSDTRISCGEFYLC